MIKIEKKKLFLGVHRFYSMQTDSPSYEGEVVSKKPHWNICESGNAGARAYILVETAEDALEKMKEYVCAHPELFSYQGMYMSSPEKRAEYIRRTLGCGCPSKPKDGSHWVEVEILSPFIF